MENITGTTNKDNKNRKKTYVVITVLFAIGCIGCIVWIACYVMDLRRAEGRMEDIRDSYVITSEESAQTSFGETVDSEQESLPTSDALQPSDTLQSTETITASIEESTLSGYELPYEAVDIAALQEKENKDIYAWISIPGTAVDYPVLQHPEKMDYYLEYNIDGTKGYPGCIYTQRMNSKDWTDKNTVLYGHNMKNGTMFAGLHNYEDLQFFEEHPYIYIYTEDGRILIYQIFAAYEYSDVHLLMTVSTRTDENFQAYLDSIFENDGLNDHFNRELELTPQDRIITLSTCISSKPSKRWLVQGVLIEEGEQVAED